VTEKRLGQAVSYFVNLLVDGEMKETEVTVGMSNISMIELIGGVSEGDQVITAIMENSTGQLTIGENNARGMGMNFGGIGMPVGMGGTVVGGPVTYVNPGGGR